MSRGERETQREREAARSCHFTSDKLVGSSATVSPLLEISLAFQFALKHAEMKNTIM